MSKVQSLQKEICQSNGWLGKIFLFKTFFETSELIFLSNFCDWFTTVKWQFPGWIIADSWLSEQCFSSKISSGQPETSQKEARSLLWILIRRRYSSLFAGFHFWPKKIFFWRIFCQSPFWLANSFSGTSHFYIVRWRFPEPSAFFCAHRINDHGDAMRSLILI